MPNRRTPDRDFNGFNDPLAKVLLGIGIVLTLMFCIVAFLASLVDVAFLGMLKPVTWLLGAYAVVGAIYGLVSGIRYGKANRSRSV
jgi:hypothetical protein